jgi:type I restriction enzyme S subunit
MSWEMVSLDKIGKISTGNTPSKKIIDYYSNGKIPFIKPNNFIPNSISYLSESDEYLTEKGANKARTIEENNVLVTCIGTIGNVGITTKQTCFNQQINAIKINTEICIPKYVALAIVNRKKHLISMANAPVVPIINKTQFSLFQIPLPPLETQKKIVNILDKAQKLIDKRKQQIDLMDSLVQSLFYDMFGDLQFNHKKIPLKPLETLTNKITDGVHQKPTYYNVGIPFISVKDIISGKIVFDNCKFISKEAHSKYINRCKPEKGDILYTKVGARYGRPAIVETNNDFSIYVSLALIKPINNLINSIYLREALKTEYVYRQAFNSIKGIGVPDLHLKEIKKFQIPVPHLNTQTQFAEKVEKIEIQKQKMQKSLKDLEQNFSSLMQRALKGEI